VIAVVLVARLDVIRYAFIRFARYSSIAVPEVERDVFGDEMAFLKSYGEAFACLYPPTED
jgi:hypothetical protein